ncbi:MAG: 6-phosphogluconolactonase [Alphaproteobacteria bacterium]|nr:6-phosphogluconolactonase [Alphaproteobacteria bacterium]
MIDLRTFETRALLMQAAAERIFGALREGVLQRGEAFAALSGGSTPEPAYRALAAQTYHWQRVTFLLVDERFVPPSHPDSNEGMLRRALAPALAAGAKLLPMYSDGTSLDEAAARADALYKDKPIDIALMGMGSDGHTASWFPQSPELAAALDRNSPRTVISVNAPGASGSPQRLTLTRSAFYRASAVSLLITGEEKRSLLLDQARGDLPVDSLFEDWSETLWAP